MAPSNPPCTPTEATTARSSRLSKLFLSTIKGNKTIKTSNDAKLFLEAICDQRDRVTCIERLSASPPAMHALRTALRFDISPDFINKDVQCLLAYMNHPGLNQLCNGDYIRQILTVLVEPPTLWQAFVQSHDRQQLTQNTQDTYAWLVLQLLIWPGDGPVNAYDIAKALTKSKCFISSPSLDARTLGYRIQSVLQNLDSKLPLSGIGTGPGGRHDNDFVDFRKIAIYPTEDELLSQDKPFYRRADTIEEAEADQRVAMHLDNQFRLLREDMLGELRQDVLSSQQHTRGRKPKLRLRGLSLYGSNYSNGKNRFPFTLLVNCEFGLERLAKLDAPGRKKFLAAHENRNFLKHGSFGCLVNQGRVVAFATILRFESLLVDEKRPAVALSIEPGPTLEMALLSLSTSTQTEFITVDTAMFAYEPILACLQSKMEFPLAKHLLCFGSKDDLDEDFAPVVPRPIIDKIACQEEENLQSTLKTCKTVKLDDSQRESLLCGLTQPVSLIQGPPGTGKSYIGALLAKAFYDRTQQTVLVLSYTNHALDQFPEDLLDIGIPQAAMVRLGSRSSNRTECLSLYKQSSNYRRSNATWEVINDLESKMKHYESVLRHQLSGFIEYRPSKAEILDFLEFSNEDADIFHALQVPAQEDGMQTVGKHGRGLGPFYLYDRWASGKDAGVLKERTRPEHVPVWAIPLPLKKAKIEQWTTTLLQERISTISDKVGDYNECRRRSSLAMDQRTVEIFKQKRIIACTTTAAAKYTQQLQSASPGVVLVEEAGEILESHVLTAMTPHTKQLILIGDHQQLRPKVDNYALTVAKGDGYDLNRSLFERLIMSGLPHTTLNQQHRMCPEISSLVRHLTYPNLLDAPQTQIRPSIRGLQSRVVFINHCHLEDQADLVDRRDEGATISKQNTFEVQMVLKIVRYMAQQGYGTANQVILTPYLGQLSLLRQALSKDNDPVLNDLDSFDLVKAGLMPTASANQSKQPIKLSTIDNYQGEESDVVIATLTRSNTNGEIGFMAEPERLNVLLSRARDALIMIGNAETFMASRKGEKVWRPFLDILSQRGQVYNGLPVQCEQHPDQKNILGQTDDFEKHCPDGGCAALCGAMLACGLHQCPQHCHQLSDHSKMRCEQILKSRCPQNHETSHRCFQKNSLTCSKCESEARKLAKKLQRDLELDEKRDRLQKLYAQQLSEIQDEIAHERRLMRERRDREQQESIIQQHRNDLAAVQREFAEMSVSKPDPDTQERSSKATAKIPQPAQTLTAATSSAQAVSTGPQQTTGLEPQSPQSAARDEWEHQKRFENADNDALDELMRMIGLENIKEQFLGVKAKVDTAVRQNIDLKGERLGAALLGNPGTGKTTVARLYAKFLSSVGALPGSFVVETTGARLANEGVTGCKKQIDDILNNGGGAMFIDEAYQLTSGNNHGGGSVLDFLLAEVENLTGKIVFILAGYNKQMESFFAHNPGIPSRFPIEMHFKDYEDSELLDILQYRIDKRYRSRMQIELGMRGLYARIVSRRIGRGRGKEGFGNARAVENMISRITDRQAKRLRIERKAGKTTEDLKLTKEDLLGPEPSDVLSKNKAWTKLQQLTGLGSVKESVRALFDSITTNYRRELEEQPLVEYTLNKVFLGSPGTGKTTVAKLYGQILADIGLLSSGEVVIKTPADFVGSVLGATEAATKGILSSTIGKVLVIDEAYGLYGGNSAGSADPYKTAVIDTIVAEVQSVPGEDQCVLLIGYQAQMEEMFQNVNQGLTRRFPLDSAFVFEDFTDVELDSILDLKLTLQGFGVTPRAKKVALEMLSRARNRPNFGNAGEVDILLNGAKLRQQKRVSKEKGSISSMFEAQDFDPDFARSERAVTNVAKLFEGTVGCDKIIAQLQGYQMTAANMRARNMDPKEQIPFAFLFRGPPGTGKTTTARRMGKVYYDMGFLSKAELVECSVTDLVGQYIGQTGPKTHKCMEKALGKVLFIDEAYRLAEGHFAKEAMDEIVDCLTKPQFFQKLIVILAGYDADINRLMSINPGLTSRFPETVVFESMDAKSCLDLFIQLLKKKNLDVEVLDPPSKGFAITLLHGFNILAGLDNWGSARDVQTLAKGVFGQKIKSASTDQKQLVVSQEDILQQMNDMIAERKHRSQHGARLPTIAPELPLAANELKANPIASTAIAHRLNHRQAKDSNTLSPMADPDAGVGADPEHIVTRLRDMGVSDADWHQLQLDREAAAAREQELRQALKVEQDLRAAIAHASALELIAKQRELDEIERKRKQMEEELKKEAAVKAKLMAMGVCCMGYAWIKQSSGYRCAGGSHFMLNDQIGNA